ncbi:hypothetical protein [Candidatus Rhabdochlamydia sp. W815]|uniref:hypothetical protein n=1 Tax=Candidatus Rhabdochlamydia sp. W815 TaxID=2720721 RepID=UPI001BFC11E9|nr:hypothetical protein [Candidatus Rhabdochlamydia sp. W815]
MPIGFVVAFTFLVKEDFCWPSIVIILWIEVSTGLARGLCAQLLINRGVLGSWLGSLEKNQKLIFPISL